MYILKKFTCILTLLVTLTGLLVPQGGFAITLAEEEELSREFMNVIFNRFKVVKDPYIDQYVNLIGQRILNAVPAQPFSYRFYVIDSDVYNAFATPAGHIFIYRGLIEAMDTEDELAGILAHEIAHVQCRHISDKIDRSSKLNLTTLAGLAAGIFLGMGGAEAAGQALAVGSMAAVQSMELEYSRADEIQADKLGLDNMTRAGYNATELMTILNKIRSKRWFDNIPTYLSTHPAAEDRIAYIDSWSQNQTELPYRGITEDFRKAKIRLLALYGSESKAVSHFRREVNANPDNLMARYGYGLVLARIGHRQEAVLHLRTALEYNPLDSSILAELGRIYFLDGRLPDALNTLKGAISLSENVPETLFYLGRTKMALGMLDEAVSIFSRLVKDHSDYDQAYYFLGESYGRQGHLAQAHYYLGWYYSKQQDPKNAIFHFQKALESTQDPARKKEIEDMLKKSRKDFKDIRKYQ